MRLRGPESLDAFTVNVGQVVLCLFHKPAFFRTAENFGKAHGHLRRNAALAVHQFGKRVAGETKCFGDVCLRRFKIDWRRISAVGLLLDQV